MIRKSIFDTPATPRLFTFLEWVRDGQLFIPDFQRPFVWDDERRLNLLDSVSRGLPIGAFLVWRTRRDELRTYEKLGPFALPKPQKGEVQTFLIDGHQRLTTLYAALSPMKPGDRERLGQEAARWPVYFDLEADDEDRAFVLAPRRRGFRLPRTWLPANELFSNRDLWKRQRSLEGEGKTALAERVEALANAFKDYMVPVMPLVTDDMRAVTDSFVRVNSGGRPMAEDKLLRSLIYTKYRIDEHIDQVQGQLAAIGWGGLESQVFVNALKIRLGLDVYRSTPADIEKAIKEASDNEATFRRSIDEIGVGMHAAAKLFRASGFPGPALLPYQYQLIGLSEALLRVSKADPEQLEALYADPQRVNQVGRWLWRTTYSGHFTGMTSSQIRVAIGALTNLVENPRDELPKLTSDNVEPLDEFHANATRSMALVLCMAQAIEDERLKESTWARLGERGLPAVECIFPELSSTLPGNRVVTIPQKLYELRAALSLAPSLFPIEDNLYRDHFVSEAARDALHEDGPMAFCEARAQYLAELERSFVENLGLRFDD